MSENDRSSCGTVGAWPRPAEVGKVRGHHRRLVRHLIALMRGGGGIVLLTPVEPEDRGKFAGKCACAWNQMMGDAERRHVDFWERHDRGVDA